jgi:hypothetical protein
VELRHLKRNAAEPQYGLSFIGDLNGIYRFVLICNFNYFRLGLNRVRLHSGKTARSYTFRTVARRPLNGLFFGDGCGLRDRDVGYNKLVKKSSLRHFPQVDLLETVAAE